MGGQRQQVFLEKAPTVSSQSTAELTAVGEAFVSLAAIDPGQSQIVECDSSMD
ncbi:MAG TPA: hypothetical protein VNM72_14010 [Blastocatellia bacterium]|nr:hypothetical protein [Blastocatellia bacterium]